MKTESNKIEDKKPKLTPGDIFAQNPEVAGHVKGFSDYASKSLSEDGLCFTAEDRAEITEYICKMAEEGKLPGGVAEAMARLEKKVTEEQADKS